MSRLDLVVGQIARVRKYTVRLLENVDPADWFRQPSGGVSHVAWQAGHIAVANHRLALERIRGSRPEDKELIAPDYPRHFGRESVPNPDPSHNPTPAEILATLARVHQETLEELRGLPEQALDQAAFPPRHPLFDTKLGALLWCAQHEMLHAGQIGLLRRFLGYPPLW